MKRIQILLAGITAVLIWSAIPVLAKVTLASIGMTQYLLVRFGMGGLVMLPWLPQVWALRKKISAKLWILLSLDLVLNFSSQSLAMRGLPASWYIVVFSLNPVFVLLFLNIKISRAKWMALIAAMIGMLSFVQGGAPVRLVDMAYIIVGMMTWVYYTILIAKFQKIFNDTQITAITHFVAALSIFALWLIDGAPFTPLSGWALGAVVILGVSSPMAYFLFSYALRHLPVFGVASQYLEPVFGTALAFFVFGERFTWLQIAAAIVIVISTIQLAKKNN